MLRDVVGAGCGDSSPIDEGDGTGDGPGHKSPEAAHGRGDGNGVCRTAAGYGDGATGNGSGGSFTHFPIGHASALFNPHTEDFGAVVLYTRLFHERTSHETTQ